MASRVVAQGEAPEPPDVRGSNSLFEVATPSLSRNDLLMDSQLSSPNVQSHLQLQAVS